MVVLNAQCAMCSHTRDICEALCVFLRPWSLQEGYALDDGVVQAAVKACCRAGRPSEAEAVLVKSLERGLVPEVRWLLFALG